MEKCKLKHCEFAWNGQCCLVCPKGLYRVNPREEQRKKIERGIRMLKRVKRRLPKEKKDRLPLGICLYKGVYRVNMSVKSKAHTLGHFLTLEEAMDVRADAMEAKENGNFDAWLKKFKATYKPPKRGKKTAGRGCQKNDKGTE